MRFGVLQAYVQCCLHLPTGLCLLGDFHRYDGLSGSSIAWGSEIRADMKTLAHGQQYQEAVDVELVAAHDDSGGGCVVRIIIDGADQGTIFSGFPPTRLYVPLTLLPSNIDDWELCVGM